MRQLLQEVREAAPLSERAAVAECALKYRIEVRAQSSSTNPRP
jgi:hypothetical protein